MKKLNKRTISAGLIGVTALATVPVLIKGRIAKEGEFPAIVRITSNSGAGCTAAIVGPNALLTAAHCVSDGGNVSFSHSGKKYKSEPCEHHSGYKSNKTKDFALCKTKDVSEPWANINTDHEFVKVGDKILLTGYGCINSDGKGADGYLRVGEAKVVKIPTKDNFDIVSNAGAALCFGDSGGPAFKDNRLIAVNSRGNIKDTSYVSAVHMADQSFFKAWSDKNRASICGLNLQCGKSEEQQPPPAPEKPGPESESLWSRIIWSILGTIWDWIWE